MAELTTLSKRSSTELAIAMMPRTHKLLDSLCLKLRMALALDLRL